ncbi:DUF4373 domain-containing protein [Paenibacillus chitinolyticus]|uniref:DUF4373 domain-containing protein n=1 Tax=Paenibacillus chitinolyticus TaxID=79263 RepID=UPI002DBE836F|nr:DUF4373 domain-containing protein [Paenibacillus chitinolyticus]MEC0248871.1 DUF4373 domain-containing protein [Paenibacillus chitinolyticus]
MVRPIKMGLDYFPLDTDIDTDDKLAVVIGKYKNQGFGIVVRLMMVIYRNGYFYPWTEREQYAFATKVNEEVETVRQVVEDCLMWGFFDQEQYEVNEILTSKGFQKRYNLATDRRKGAEIDPAHNLLTVNVDNNPEQVELMPAETPQKKRKEIKENICTRFEEFWSIYPKKAAPKDAEKAWAALIKEKAQINDVLIAARSYAEECKREKRDKRFIKLPATFLRQDRWKDHLPEEIEPVIGSEEQAAFDEWVRGGNAPSNFVYSP